MTNATAAVPEELAALGFRGRREFSVPPRDSWGELLRAVPVHRFGAAGRLVAVLPAALVSAHGMRVTIWDVTSDAVYCSTDAEFFIHVTSASAADAAAVRDQLQHFLDAAIRTGIAKVRRAPAPARASSRTSTRTATRSNATPAARAAATDPNASAGAEPPRRFALTDEQRNTVAMVTSGKCDFALITGAAGTGKSVVVRELLRETHTLAVAPTGMAALAVKGLTVHRAFGLPAAVCLPELIARPNEQATRLLTGIRRLIVDEVSMLRADLLDAMDITLRALNHSEEPFGGVQVVLIGDPYQLPPVARPEDLATLADLGYKTPFFYSAHVIKRTPPLHVELRRQHRQSDAEFLGILHRLRRGHHHDGDLARLNSRVTTSSGRTADVLHLCTRNADADAINAQQLDVLRGKAQRYFATDAWPLAEKPAEGCVMLKVGARVLFTKNDATERWVNGTRGVVTRLSESTVHVRLEDGETLEVTPQTWELREPIPEDEIVPVPEAPTDPEEEQAEASSTAEEPRWRVVGRYTQLPLRLGWAITIHKSQGMTLDRVVIDLGRGGFSTGQVYVALSRLRRLSDLTLTTPIRESDIRVETRTERFLTWLPRATAVRP